MPVALVVVLSLPVLLVAAGLGLVAAGAYARLRQRRPQWRAIRGLSWLFVFLRYRVSVRRRT